MKKHLIALLLRPLEWVATAILTVLIFGAAFLRNAIDRSEKSLNEDEV